MKNLIHRPRRLRRSPAIRSMVRETQLQVSDLVAPLFVTHEKTARKEIASMPGQYQFSITHLCEEAQQLYELGVPGLILFGIPPHKDAGGSHALRDNGIIQQAVRAVKKAVPEMYVITDLCFCEYTDHGHCGPIIDGEVDNDATLELLGKQALSHAKAGVDMVAPSGMMDGMVQAIRSSLDADGFSRLPILSYAVKYASAFYGPFRDAAESTPQFGDRRGYQMDPANAREALREAELDLQEGADMLMVKPALAYLDIIQRLKTRIDVPLAAYNVSGEYAMIKAASQNGWLDEKRVVLETLTSIKRAGAEVILTYYAKQVARWLNV